MKKYKLLLLATIGTGLLSGLSFAQDFPVTVTANITAPASQIQLLIDGTQADSVDIDFGKTTVGTAVPQKELSINVQTKDRFGNWVDSSRYTSSFKNKTLSTEQGKAVLAINRGQRGMSMITANFTPLSSGDFRGKTDLAISIQDGPGPGPIVGPEH